MRLQLSISWAGIGVDLIATKDELNSAKDFTKVLKETESACFIGGISVKDLERLFEGVTGSEDGWISVDDSMPKLATPVLISSPSLPHVLIAVWERKDLWRVVASGGITSAVTHWQPLPEKAK